LFYSEHDTPEGAAAEGFANCDKDVIYVGEVFKGTISAYLNQHTVDQLLESLVEAACDECGEAAVDWLSREVVRREDGESLDDHKARVMAARERYEEKLKPLMEDIKASLEKWANEHKEQPNFFGVRNVKEYRRDGLS
jgi:hypothetical protein